MISILHVSKVRTTNITTWQRTFLCKVLPKLEFCKIQVWMNLIQCCVTVGWTYLVLVIHLIFFSNPGKVSDKNTQRNISTIIFICSIHKAMLQIIRSSYYDLISACFRTLSLSMGNHQFMSAEWFPLQR